MYDVVIIGFLLLLPQHSFAQASCIPYTHAFGINSSDRTTGGEVSRLQQFLASLGPTTYPEAKVTGFFGPATERALQRWQAARGLASYGSAATTGWGYVGARTRASLTSYCNDSSTGNARIIANAVTPDTITAAFTNLPPNSQIVLVDFYSNSRLDSQSTVIWGGGSGSASIPVASLLQGKPGSMYYLRVIDYYNPGKTIAQSDRFQAGGFAANAPYCSITADKSTANVGDPILLTWTSNAQYAVGSIGFPVNDQQRPANGSVTVYAQAPGLNTFGITFQGDRVQSYCSVNILVPGASAGTYAPGIPTIAPAPVTVSTSLQPSIFVTPQGFATLRPPVNWKSLPIIDAPQGPLEMIIFVNPTGDAALTLIVGPRFKQTDIDAEMASTTASLQAKGIQNIRTTRTTFNGYPAFTLDGIDPSKGETQTVRGWIIITPTVNYALVALTRQTDWNMYASIIEQSAMTLQVR